MDFGAGFRMKIGFAALIAFSVLTRSHVTCAAAADEKLTAAFHDPAVSTEDFLSQAGVKSPDQLKALLPALYRTTASALFKEVGTIASFDHTPPEYGVRHAINYYIPKSYVADGNARTLVILHGGGASTNTYESSRDVSRQYMQSFVDFAEKNRVVLIGPSSSLGWSYIGRILITETLELAERELALDPDHITIWGHSMGAMGITREAHWLADTASTFMPNAGGMQDEFRIDPFFMTYFDTRMVHMQGLYDEFEVFVERTRAVEARMHELEKLVGRASGYEAIFEERDHNPDMVTVVAKLESDVLQTGRDKYRVDIHPLVERLDAKDNRLGPDVDTYTRSRYYWIETPNLATDLPRKEFDQGQGENFVSFEASVHDNTYDIQLSDDRISKIRVLVSSKMVDLAKPIKVRLNGGTKFEGRVTADAARMLEIARARKDRSFVFENAIEIRTTASR